MVSRRTLLAGALALPLAACAAPTATRPASKPATDPVAARFAALERKYGARLGVYAVATGSGRSVAYRADERFAFCSTFKTLAAAAVLTAHPLSHLDAMVTITRADVNSISPITERHIGTGMTIRDLCDAAIRYSDGTAGNLLMRDIGGPAALTAYLRGLGDGTSRMDQYEPGLNRDAPGDPRDTTTPRAVAAHYRQVVLGTALPADRRSLIVDRLRRSTTGAQAVRAGVPAGWTVGDKTGHGDYGRPTTSPSPGRRAASRWSSRSCRTEPATTPRPSTRSRRCRTPGGCGSRLARHGEKRVLVIGTRTPLRSASARPLRRTRPPRRRVSRRSVRRWGHCLETLPQLLATPSARK